MNRKELKAKAEDMGVTVEDGMTKAQIQEAMDAVSAENAPEDDQATDVEIQSGGGNPPPPPEPETKPQSASSGDTVKNVSTSVHYVCGRRLAPGAEVALSANNKKDEHAMQRVERAVKMGLLERG